jgi:methylmalonyl-CoA mutase cobalamin-binding domain/chain
MGDLEEDVVEKILNKVMAEGGGEAPRAMEACQEGMNIVGDRFESNEYFIGDLICAGELMTSAVGILKDALIKSDGSSIKTKLILCTVKGDLHDIGKNIVKAMLDAGGFEVIDLGIDVPPEKIVEEVKKTGVTIVALSAVLTVAINAMKNTVDMLHAAGLRDKVKVIVGGAPINANYCKIIGADAWSLNPQEGVQICKKWAAA